MYFSILAKCLYIWTKSLTSRDMYRLMSDFWPCEVPTFFIVLSAVRNVSEDRLTWMQFFKFIFLFYLSYFSIILSHRPSRKQSKQYNFFQVYQIIETDILNSLRKFVIEKFHVFTSVLGFLIKAVHLRNKFIYEYKLGRLSWAVSRSALLMLLIIWDRTYC